MSLPFRVKRAARRRAATVSARLNPDRGPEWWQQLVERAQVTEARRRLANKDLDGARTLLQPHVDRPSPTPRAMAALAELCDRSGDHDAALAAARAAVAGGDREVPFEARMVHHRLVARQGLREETEEALAALIDTRPRNRREARATFDVLRTATAQDVDRFYSQLRTWDVFDDEQELAELHEGVLAELELMAASPEELDTVVAAVDRRLAHPLAPIARALHKRSEWARLADYSAKQAGDPTAEPIDREAALELRRAASQAFKAGHLAPAQHLATRALTGNPDDHFAQRTRDITTDQLTIAREGWTAPVLASGRAYEPQPRAVMALLGQSPPHMSGGYATRTHGLLTGLASHGWSIEGVTRLGFPYDRWSKHDPRRVEDVDEVDGIRYHHILESRVPGPFPDYPLVSYVDRYAKAVVQHALRFRPSLLQASSFPVNGLAARQAAAELGVPYVYEMRGLEDLLRQGLFPDFDDTDRRKFLDVTELAACEGAARVFVITEALRKEMAARGVPEEKLRVLPNGVHTSLFQPRERDAELEAELGLRGKTVIGYAGGMVHYEGLELLLEAAAELRARRTGPDGPDFHVVIVGSGSQERSIKAAAGRLGLGDVVTFTGRVPHDQVGRYVSLFDIAPFPRLPLRVCELISPMKPFESMAMGKAVIVSSVAALTEIISDEVTGLVFEKGSATDLARVIERYIDDPGLRRAMGEAARAWVQAERDWSSILAKVSAEYEQVLTESAG